MSCGYVRYTTALVGGGGAGGAGGTAGGPGAAVLNAGALLRQLSGKQRRDPYTSSFALSHLGFWVDNGSPYYHRNTSYAASVGLEACNRRLNCTLQDALLAVKADAAQRQIPLRYFQFDDHESLDAYHWPATPSTPYLNSESYAQKNAGDVVFQSGVTFLGDDPFSRSAAAPFPTSLYIGHGDTRPCNTDDPPAPFPGDHDGPRCPHVQNRSESGWEWYDGVCVSQAFFEQLMDWGIPAGMKMFEQVCRQRVARELARHPGRPPIC
jgi:hypothetical protein